MWHVTNLFQKVVQYNKTIGFLRPRAILPASGEQIVMSPSLKGDNCIILFLISERLISNCGPTSQIQVIMYVLEDGSGVLYSENSIVTATRIIMYCGTGLNALFTVLLTLAMLMNSQNRQLPRMWLLLYLFVAHIAASAYQVFLLQHTYWETFHWTHTSCTLIYSIGPCFDFVTSLIVALLACHVFMWTFIPNAEKGRKTLAFWIVAGLLSWILGFAILLSLYAPYTEVVTISGQTSYTICTTKRFIGGAITITEFCITFALPYLFALPVACVSMCFIVWRKTRTEDEISVELEVLPETSQTTPEYFGVIAMENDTAPHTREAGRRKPTLWVVFSVLLIYCGIPLRLPYRLIELGYRSYDYRTILLAFDLLRVVYYSFILLVSLVLPEIREVLLGVYRNCKRICHRA